MYRITAVLMLLSLLLFAACKPKEQAQQPEATEKSEPVVITSILDFHDTNDDGMIMLDEYRTNMKRLFDLRDANGDGFHDEAEARAKLAIIFKRWDVNNDQKITLDEMKTAIVGSGWEEVGTEGLECSDNPPLQFNVIDRNGDGTIERAEHLTFIEKRFQMFDMNSDGMIDEPELTEVMYKEHLSMDQDGDQTVSKIEHSQFQYQE